MHAPPRPPGPELSPTPTESAEPPGPNRRTRLPWLVAQIAVAALSGGALAALGVPGGWLSGAVLSVAALALMGRVTPLPAPLTDLAMLLTGVALGAGATPEAFAAMARYPLSLLALLAAMAAITLASAAWLVRRPPWRRDEALLASVPGALGAVMAVAAARNGDLTRIGVVQLVRLIALIALLPGLIVATKGGLPRLDPAPPLTAEAFAALLLLGWMIGALYRRANLAAPLLLGAMTISVAAHGTGLVRGNLPEPIAILAFVLLGAFIGLRLNGLTPAVLRQSLPDALVSFVIGLAVSVVFALLAAWLTGVGFAAALVAFAPGGLEAMVALALILDLDPLYVAAHHLVRFLSIGFLLPVLFRARGKPPF